MPYRCSAPGIRLDRMARFAERLYSGCVRTIESIPLRGGLECPGIARISGTVASERGVRPFVFVVKRLEGVHRREARIYRQALTPGIAAPGLLGVDESPAGHWYLYLEYVRPESRWPWKDMSCSRQTLQALAGWHRSSRSGAEPILQTWDYESELRESAHSTWELFESALCRPEASGLKRYRRPLERMVIALPRCRQELLSSRRFGTTPIHGDAHPGNAVVRVRRGAREPVLLDWARARLGSPLEDVSSWLESLGYWEPEAKRHHDTLLRYYLEAREGSNTLLREVRDLYWLAGVSNLLAGALRYYLYVAMDDTSRTGPNGPNARVRRERALHAAKDHLRVVRRADALWSA